MDKPEATAPPYDWAGAQRRFLDAVAAFGGAQALPLNAWQKAMDFWWQGVRPSVPGPGRDLFENLIGQWRTLFGIAERCSRLVSAVPAGDGAPNWEGALAEHIEAWKAEASDPAGDTLRGLLSAWQLPADTWQRILSLIPAPPAATPGRPSADPARGLPGRAAEGARLWDEYQRALEDYRELLSGIAVDALNRLHIRILAAGAEGRPLTTLRQIFNLWIDCNEAAYAECAFTPAFPEAFGRLVNSLMAFRRHGLGLVDEALAAANLPTRHALDAVHREQQRMRREVRESAARTAANAESLQRIRDELERLRGQPGGADK